MSLAILDVQHGGRRSRPGDLGAQSDLDHDGQVEAGEHEVELVRRYVARARERLEAGGIEVLVLAEGEYAERHERACRAARDRPQGHAAYVACHLNAGGSDYGLVVYDRRSLGSAALADLVAWHLGQLCRPPLRRVVVSWTGPQPEAPYPRAWPCLRRIFEGPPGLSGILVEPCFLDQPDHAGLLDDAGLDRIGLALALGVSAWLLGRAA